MLEPSTIGHLQDYLTLLTNHRLSYLFGLMGPCISTDTACSSSLVAAHLAHRGLLAGEATHAVAAGVNLALSPTTTVAICQLQALSVVGRCRWGSLCFLREPQAYNWNGGLCV